MNFGKINRTIIMVFKKINNNCLTLCPSIILTLHLSVVASSMVESWLCKNLHGRTPVQIMAKLLKLNQVIFYQIQVSFDDIEER